MEARKTLDDIVFENGLTDILRLERARRESTERNIPLAATLIDLGYVDQRILAELVARATDCELIDPLPTEQASKLRDRLPSALAREAMAVPVSLEGRTLTVAMLDPTLENAVKDLAAASGLDIVPAVAVRNPLEELVDRLYPETQGEDITLMAGHRLSLDHGEATIASTQQPPEPEPFPDAHGTVLQPRNGKKSGDTTAPRGVTRTRPLEARVEALETRVVDVVRILAEVQARLEAIEDRLRRLPHS